MNVCKVSQSVLECLKETMQLVKFNKFGNWMNCVSRKKMGTENVIDTEKQTCIYFSKQLLKSFVVHVILEVPFDLKT